MLQRHVGGARVNTVVLSTGWKSPHASVCKASVHAQGVGIEHRYVEASEQTPKRTKLENLVEMASDLAPDTMIAFVDGDDWLSHRGALERAAIEHAHGAWVTYGSFVQSDGKPGFAAPYPTPEYRKHPWLGTHLKTVRAGLFNRIDRAHLHYRGEWIDRGDDPSFMWPCMEMAGPDRVNFIPDVLYVYSYSTSWELTASAAERQHERDIVAHVRKLPPYERLESL